MFSITMLCEIMWFVKRRYICTTFFHTEVCFSHKKSHRGDPRPFTTLYTKNQTQGIFEKLTIPISMKKVPFSHLVFSHIFSHTLNACVQPQNCTRNLVSSQKEYLMKKPRSNFLFFRQPHFFTLKLLSEKNKSKYQNMLNLFDCHPIGPCILRIRRVALKMMHPECSI